MPATSSEPHTIVQSWVRVELAQELKARGRAEGRSLSSLVRDALENFAETSGEPRPPVGTPRSPAGGPDASEEL